MQQEEKDLLILQKNTPEKQRELRYNELARRGIPEPELSRAVNAEFIDYPTPTAVEPWPGPVTGVDLAGNINLDIVPDTGFPPVIQPNTDKTEPFPTPNQSPYGIGTTEQPYPSSPTPDPYPPLGSAASTSNTYNITNFPAEPSDNWSATASQLDSEPSMHNEEGYNSHMNIPPWQYPIEDSQMVDISIPPIAIEPSGQFNEVTGNKKKIKKSLMQKLAPYLGLVGSSFALSQLVKDYMDEAPEEPGEDRNHYFTHTPLKLMAEFTLSSRHKIVDVCDDYAGKSFNLLELERPILPTEGKGYTNLVHPHCLLPDTEIEFPNGIESALRTWYSGPVIEILTSKGATLTVTPNHLFLTPQGFITADFLRKGDEVLNSSISKRKSFGINPNNNRKPSTIKQVFDSLLKSSGSTSFASVPPTPEYLHGDTRFTHGNIDVVRPNGFLSKTGATARFKHFFTGFFNRCYSNLSFLSRHRSLALCLEGLLTPSDRSMSGSRKTASFYRGRLSHTQTQGFTSPTGGNTILLEMFDDVSSTTLENFRESLDRFSSIIQLDEILNINVKSYTGFVYDIQTKSTLYSGNSIIISNCQCLWKIKKVNTPEATLTRKQKTSFDDIAQHIEKAAKDHTLHTVKPDGELSSRTRGTNPMKESIGKIRHESAWLTDEYLGRAKEAAIRNGGQLYLIRAATQTITDHRAEGEQYRRKLSGKELNGMARTAIGTNMDINHNKDYATGGEILDSEYDQKRKEIQMLVMETDPQIIQSIENGDITAVSINGGNPRRQTIEPCYDGCDGPECELCNTPSGVILGELDGIGMTYVVTVNNGIMWRGNHIPQATPGVKDTKIEIL